MNSFFSFSLPHALSGLQQHKGMCSLTSPSENYYRKPATKYKLSNQCQSQPHRCWDPKMLSWTKELTTGTQQSLLANTTTSETMNSCFTEVFWRNVFCSQRLKTPLFSVNIKMINSLNRQLHGEAMCYRHYLLQYFQSAAPKEILSSLLTRRHSRDHTRAESCSLW